VLELVKEARSRSAQKEKILDFARGTLLQFRRSGLIGLLEKAAKEYR
jgi:hypothetical protein